MVLVSEIGPGILWLFLIIGHYRVLWARKYYLAELDTDPARFAVGELGNPSFISFVNLIKRLVAPAYSTFWRTAPSCGL